MNDPVLQIEGLTAAFRINGAWHPAVRDLDLTLMPNETLAVVGESGCGKSVTALSIMRLGTGRVEGRVRFGGRDLLALSEAELSRIRGDRMAMIFQEPMTSLNPVLKVGFQVSEPLMRHRGLDKAAARKEALALFERVRIPSAALRLDDFPHQFSGGMRQRVMIAMALACQPDLLLADEPTTALDVTVQAQILALLAELQRERRMAMIFITHNLGVVAAIADRVAVMYAGEMVEMASVETLFAAPTHPYTEALLRSIPRLDRDGADLAAIPGQVPPIDRMPGGCRFAPRCPYREAACETVVPVLAPLGGDPAHLVRCRVRAPA